jgi:hypothetical protein
MPLPDEDEILDMHRVLEPTMDEADVKTRLRRWGPVPRWVLFTIDPRDQRERWNATTATTVAVLCASQRGMVSGGDGARGGSAFHHLVVERARGQVDRTLDIRSPAYYDEGDILIPTLELMERVVLRVAEEKAWAAMRFVELSSLAPTFATVGGRVFEVLAFARLARGGTFRARKLVARAGSKVLPVQDWSLPAQDVAVWEEDAELDALRVSRALLRPKQPNKPGVDGAFWVPSRDAYVVFNATVAKTHDINELGLKRVADALEPTASRMPATRRVALVWVVPDDVAAHWLAKSKTSDASLGDRLDQYVLSVGPWHHNCTLEADAAGAGAGAGEGPAPA